MCASAAASNSGGGTEFVRWRRAGGAGVRGRVGGHVAARALTTWQARRRQARRRAAGSDGALLPDAPAGDHAGIPAALIAPARHPGCADCASSAWPWRGRWAAATATPSPAACTRCARRPPSPSAALPSWLSRTRGCARAVPLSRRASAAAAVAILDAVSNESRFSI